MDQSSKLRESVATLRLLLITVLDVYKHDMPPSFVQRAEAAIKESYQLFN
jgi:hypothetical protein